MKKLIFISSLFLFVSFGCSDFDRRTQFRTTYTNRVVLDTTNTLPGYDHEVNSDTLVSDFVQLIKDHSSTESKVESVTLVGLSLEVDGPNSPDQTNFDFLKDLEIFLRGENTPEFLVGSVDSVPRGRIKYFEIRVVPEGEDFTDFLKTEDFICRMTYTTNARVKDSSVTLKITPEYLIDTKKFGI